MVSNNEYLLLTISYSEATYSITPVEQLKASLYDHFCISEYFVYFIYIHINNNKFTYDKYKTAKFGFSVFDVFSQVSLKLFTFLINTTDIEIDNMYKSKQYFTTDIVRNSPGVQAVQLHK